MVLVKERTVLRAMISEEVHKRDNLGKINNNRFGKVLSTMMMEQKESVVVWHFIKNQ